MELTRAPPGGKQSKGANLPQLYGQPTEAIHGLQSRSGKLIQLLVVYVCLVIVHRSFYRCLTADVKSLIMNNILWVNFFFKPVYVVNDISSVGIAQKFR